jgi:hypothetical protein
VKKIIMILLASVSLAACEWSDSTGEDPTGTVETQSKNGVVTVTKEVTKPAIKRFKLGTPNDVIKFCDGGRAIYTTDDDNSGSMAVVPDAIECRFT